MKIQEKSSAPLMVVASVFAFPLIYVLLAGPLTWLDDRDLIPDVLLEILYPVYAPLRHFAQRFDWLEMAIDFYIGFWEKR